MVGVGTLISLPFALMGMGSESEDTSDIPSQRANTRENRKRIQDNGGTRTANDTDVSNYTVLFIGLTGLIVLVLVLAS